MFNLKAPQSIFVHADGFYKASLLLNKDPATGQFDPLVFASLVTNSAFASELYLKCFIQMTTGVSFFKQHDLRKLFSKLPDVVQAEIEKRFDAEMAKQPEFDLSKAPKEAQEAAAKRPKTFRDSLKLGAAAFEEWRYLYEFEKDDQLNAFNLFPLPGILRAMILERMPQWGTFGFKMTKLADRIPPTSQAQSKPEPTVETPAAPAGDNQ